MKCSSVTISSIIKKDSFEILGQYRKGRSNTSRRLAMEWKFISFTSFRFLGFPAEEAWAPLVLWDLKSAVLGRNARKWGMIRGFPDIQSHSANLGTTSSIFGMLKHWDAVTAEQWPRIGDWLYSSRSWGFDSRTVFHGSGQERNDYSSRSYLAEMNCSVNSALNFNRPGQQPTYSLDNPTRWSHIKYESISSAWDRHYERSQLQQPVPLRYADSWAS